MPQMNKIASVKYSICFSRTKGARMTGNAWKIALICRTIGADRGRAARGDPAAA